MARELDHYKVLGVARDATIEEVKLAYRKAALSCHPDNYDGDPAEAERKLRTLIEAYKAIARELEPAAWSNAWDGRTFTPQDFARQGYSAYWRPTLAAPRRETARASTAPSLTLTHTKADATRNETRIFVTFWIVAIVLGVLVGVAAACYRAWTAGPDPISVGDVVLSILIGELIYVALAVTTVVLIVLTRKVIRLTLELAHRGWRFLPGRTTDRELPGPPSDRELPAAKDVEKGDKQHA